MITLTAATDAVVAYAQEKGMKLQGQVVNWGLVNDPFGAAYPDLWITTDCRDHDLHRFDFQDFVEFMVAHQQEGLW